MNTVVMLDTGPLGLVTNPKGSDEAMECNRWLVSLLKKGIRVCVPEIADYELRRELLRAQKRKGLERLDALKSTICYLPISTEAMLKAAAFWAEARNKGRPTADNKALDGDMILCGQAAILAQNNDNPIIATTNVGHFSFFSDAYHWQEISFSTG
jgi:predicted nucleic acid-binding protein